MPIIRSISGLRATLEDSLTDELVVNYCRAFHKILGDGPVVLGRDGRPSGEHIEAICIDTLIKSGREVRVAGIVPTPTVQLLTEHSVAAGGIVITASHNPAEWNGLKFIGSVGVFIDAEKNAELWRIVDSQDFDDYTFEGRLTEIEDANSLHIQRILELNLVKEYLPEIKLRKFKAVVDAVNASGSVIVPELLRQLGVDVIELFCDKSGNFPHLPEPLPQNLTSLATAVIDNKADIGIAVDPDADRLVLIDETGSAIGEELTIAIAVHSVLSNSKFFTDETPTVVVNLSTTRLIDDIADNYNAKLMRAAVGEINVVNKMRECNAVIGGEGSGGVILPKCHYGRDSLVGIALLMTILAEEKKSLSKLCSMYPKYTILKNKFEFSGNIKNIVDAISNDYKQYKINTDDGVRIDFDNSWVQMRTSNTEPIIRIIAEAITQEECQNLINQFKKYI